MPFVKTHLLTYRFLLQVVYVTATFPYIVLIIFFGRSMTLKGAGDGLRHMFTPKVSCLEVTATTEQGSVHDCWSAYVFFSQIQASNAILHTAWSDLKLF
jgi:SNF family Na+-dependent transporter